MSLFNLDEVHRTLTPKREKKARKRLRKFKEKIKLDPTIADPTESSNVKKS